MLTVGLRLLLLLFAFVGFAGAGAALAVARKRFLHDDEHDPGMLGVTVMLALFASLCTVVAVGLAGVFAFGGVIAWASYLLTAQRAGLFRIQAGNVETAPAEESRRIT